MVHMLSLAARIRERWLVSSLGLSFTIAHLLYSYVLFFKFIVDLHLVILRLKFAKISLILTTHMVRYPSLQSTDNKKYSR